MADPRQQTWPMRVSYDLRNMASARAERWSTVGRGDGRIKRIHECRIGHGLCTVYEFKDGSAEYDVSGSTGFVEEGRGGVAVAMRLAEVRAILFHANGAGWIDGAIKNALAPPDEVSDD